jgi:MFS family permease
MSPPEKLALQITPCISSANQTADKIAVLETKRSTQVQGEEPYSVFPSSTRTYLTYLLGIIMLTSTLTSTIYFPLLPKLSTDFSVSLQAINLTVTVYAVCQAISPGIFGSLADSYGRRPVLLALITLYVIASLGFAINEKNYAVLVFLRALQSFGGSATVPIAYGIVADVAVVSERGKMLEPMLSTCNGVSALGPVIGGALAMKTEGHRGVFVALLVVAVLCLLLVGFTIPETARGIVGNGDGDGTVTGIWRTWISFLGSQHKSPAPVSDNDRSKALPVPPGQSFRRILDSIRIIRHPDAAVILSMVASSYGIYYTFQVAHSVMFKEVYSYNELENGLTFLPGLVGMTIGGILAGKLIDIHYANQVRESGNLDSVETQDFPIERAQFRNIVPFVIVETALVTGYGWVIRQRICYGASSQRKLLCIS